MTKFAVNNKQKIKGLKNNEYDVIIIGAGIGGLTCGCYLAKAGQKVLILEKNNKVGGYCTSFNRGGFNFNIGIRSLSHSKKGSFIQGEIEALNLKLNLIKVDVSDVILTPDYKISYYFDIERTITNMQELFPKEAKKIKLFFDLIKGMGDNSALFSFFQEFKTRPFSSLLNQYFKDEKLKAILKVPLGNIGLPSFKASAVSSALLYHGVLLKGGYYIEGGMRALSDSLAEKFNEYGGKIELSQKVNGIKSNQNGIKQVTVNDKESFFARNVVCNCDPTQVLSGLVEENLLNKYFYSQYMKLIPSSSAFIVYLGLKNKLKEFTGNCCGLWYSSDYKVDEFYSDIYNKKQNLEVKHILLSAPSFYDVNAAPQNCESIILIMWAPYMNGSFWKKNKPYFKEKITQRAQTLIPGLSSLVCVEETADPVFLQNYTLSREGSVRGWSALPSQLRIFHLLEKIVYRKIFFVGQWSNQYAPGGLFTAMFSAKRIAHVILAKGNR